MKNIVGGFETFEVQGDCPEHGFWSMDVPKFLVSKTTKCPVCIEIDKANEVDQHAKKQHEDALKRSQEMVHVNFKKAAIPKRFLNRVFDNYHAGSEQQNLALNISKHYANNFDDRLANGGGLIMQGTPGTGKTHLACAIANQVISSGYTARFTTVMQLVRQIRATWKRDSEISEDQILKSIIDYDLLIIDEIGVQYETESERLILFDVLNGRYENVMPTILLTNLIDSELSACIGERNIDRIQEGGGAVISFTWDSYRAKVYKDDSLKGQSCAEREANKLTTFRNAS